jgi:Cu-Zn family superoxide dismutase
MTNGALNLSETNMRNLLILAAIPWMGSCSNVQSANSVSVSEVASANLVRGDGTAAGVAALSQRSDGLWLSVSADAAGVGSFGMHIHAVGKCEGPDFATAGAHWNPAAKQHGRDNPMGAHAGDMPNVSANADGKLVIETQLSGATLSGAGGVLDADGAALIIHEKADDYKTDPTGNSGKRMICGALFVSA